MQFPVFRLPTTQYLCILMLTVMCGSGGLALTGGIADIDGLYDCLMGIYETNPMTVYSKFTATFVERYTRKLSTEFRV